MKTDQLEKFVIDHRDEFDVMEPSPELWTKIALPPPAPEAKRLSATQILMRVAAVVVIFVASYYFHAYVNQPDIQRLAVNPTMSTEDRQLVEEMMESKAYYTSLINTKTDEVYQLAANQPLLRDEIKDELKELDQEFLRLQNDLLDNADNEEIIAAMIQNYRLKLQILEETLIQLQAQKHEKNNSHENKRISI